MKTRIQRRRLSKLAVRRAKAVLAKPGYVSFPCDVELGSWNDTNLHDYKHKTVGYEFKSDGTGRGFF